MENKFLNGLTSMLTPKQPLSTTENGAIGYASAGKALVDLEFAVSSLRHADEKDIGALFLKAWAEDRALALRWACYARDVRGGLGERRLFRTVLRALAEQAPEAIARLLPFVPMYGRYDDLFVLFGTKAERAMISFIVKTFRADLAAARAREMQGAEAHAPLTLLGKWMPSINASSQKTRALALRWMKILGMDARKYRKSLALLRRELRVVERDMCANRWDAIDYGAVPSRASLLYRKAFDRHDGARYQAYLSDVAKGNAVIHSAALFPYEIVAKYKNTDPEFWYRTSISPKDDTLEALWNALPAPKASAENVLVVRDGSGSMLTGIPGSEATLLDVATAMAIYCAQHVTGPLHDHFITFSAIPQLVDLTGCETLREKLVRTYEETDCSNTDIDAVFRLILETAKAKDLSQTDLPGTVLIISDMEFDGQWFGWNSVLFETIQKKYEASGYQLPRLVFWNVGSRTRTIPLLKNDLGLVLVSGFSSQIYDMVASGDLDPMEALTRVLMQPRYDPAGEAAGKAV